MLCIHNTNNDPYFNMATEEYFFKNFNDDIFMLWRNEPAIVVGKHQNTLAEINLEYVKQNGIKVVRRLSGGGAVFHDLGNLNFTFIRNVDSDKLIDFRKYTEPILEVLQVLGVNAKFEGRNDLTIDGKKFSGNAEHIVKNRVLHHGTLLFSAEMTDMTGALKVNPLKFRDKAVKSVRSRVTNISGHLAAPMSIENFTELIMNHVQNRYADTRRYEMSSEDIEAIRLLAEQKYSRWEWNFGQTANYNFEKVTRTCGGNIEVHIDADKGVIRNIKIFGDYFNRLDTADIENTLVGVNHEEEAVRKKLDGFIIDDYFKNVTLEELLQALF